MADKSTTSNVDSAAKRPPTAADRLARLFGWAGRSRLHMALVGSLALLSLVVTFSLWSYLAQLAISTEDPATLARALEALDTQNFEEARSIVGRMQRRPDAEAGFGASLFVLGAVKAAEAEQEWSTERRRAMHLVAARYLKKARSLGVPPARESQLAFLLGQSLIRGNQPQAGIDVLNEALNKEAMPLTEIHGLLTEAHLATSDLDLESALQHNQAVLSDETLDEVQRAQTLITRAGILRELGQLEEAAEQLEALSGNRLLQAQLKSEWGQLKLAKAEQLPAGNENRMELLEQALADLREAQRQDPLNGELTRQAMYWIGKCYQARQDRAAAIEQFDHIGESFGDTPESIAATLTKADLAREDGNYDQALIGYRTVLESVGDPVTYVNHLLPLSKLRKRLLRAHSHFVELEQFEQALVLVDKFPPVFNQLEVTELRGFTHKAWGAAKLAQASRLDGKSGSELAKAARYHLRAAGRDFESLSQLRFATREFTNDLWESAENYYQGQSFTHAARVLEDYLHHEARVYKARALLRLGQSRLAAGETDQAIAALEECIEMHPRDGDIYQARLECVRAYRQRGMDGKARELLLTNLTGGTLTPQSIEWRDSLFALGELLHDLGSFNEAIARLDEAVTRYPEAPQALLSRYTIARSYHSAAEDFSTTVQKAKTENERQKNRKLRDENLLAALQNYLVVQRMISLQGQSDRSDLKKTLLRNCYMMQGSVLFQLRRYEEARKAYSNVSTLYQNEPFVLESFVHISNCWRRLNQPIKARGTIEQAKLMLGTLPVDTDFTLATNFSRQQWKLLLEEMSKW